MICNGDDDTEREGLEMGNRTGTAIFSKGLGKFHKLACLINIKKFEMGKMMSCGKCLFFGFSSFERMFASFFEDNNFYQIKF